MANYQDADQGTINVFETAIGSTTLERNVNIKILADDTIKKVACKVAKANPLVKYETNNDVYITVNEIIFDQLTPEQQVLLADEAIAGIHFNSETGRITLNQPDVKTYSGVLNKYTYNSYDVLQESIKTLYEVEAQKEV